MIFRASKKIWMSVLEPRFLLQRLCFTYAKCCAFSWFWNSSEKSFFWTGI